MSGRRDAKRAQDSTPSCPSRVVSRRQVWEYNAIECDVTGVVKPTRLTRPTRHTRPTRLIHVYTSNQTYTSYQTTPPLYRDQVIMSRTKDSQTHTTSLHTTAAPSIPAHYLPHTAATRTTYLSVPHGSCPVPAHCHMETIITEHNVICHPFDFTGMAYTWTAHIPYTHKHTDT